MFTYFVLCDLFIYLLHFYCAVSNDVSHMRLPDGYNKAITYLLITYFYYKILL